MSLLIVEDVREIAPLFELLLKGAGHTVETWTSAFASTADLAPWPMIDVVICDQDIDGYDGKALLRWLAEVHPTVRRVMITGGSITTEVEASADLVLIKLVSSTAVLQST
ncbi:MAG TPA: response regulator [Jatrophihabitans sp.]|jgi:DNA-binding NtrC family response regulator|uniref:response regulator n=1 Tax=Jatrophihabitans sp. TaxID=1932789 RepID=UPI002F001E01